MSRQFPRKLLFISWLPWLLLSVLQAETWTLQDQVYQDVEIRDVNPETVVFSHRGGLGSLPLASLPDELKERFHYDPKKARAHREAQQAKIVAAQKKLEALKAESRRRPSSTLPRALGATQNDLDRVLRQLDEPLRVAEKVDLRERFAEHGLHPRNQGRRPSCSVFAVGSALGFALAENGYSGQLSEEYLLWATVEHLKHRPARVQGLPADDVSPGDAGFSLMSVVEAAQWFGAALKTEMPNRLGGSYADIDAPPEELIERSRSRRLLRAARLSGQNTEQQIEYIVKILNAGWPVTISARWPSAYTLRYRPVIDGQRPIPDYSHAVTLVGYIARDNDLRNCIFLFRNSWGVRWGIAGHGMISRDYLLEHLRDAIVIGVEPRE